MKYKDYLIFITTLLVAVSNGVFSINVNSFSLINTNSAEDSLYYDVFRKFRVQNVDSALKYAKLSYSQAQEIDDIVLSIKSLNAMGYCYQGKLLFDSALYAYKLGVEQAKSSDNKQRQMWLYNSIGIVYDNIEKYDSAIANYYASLKIARILESPKDISVALTNIGNINLSLGQAESAVSFYLQAAEIEKSHDFKGIEETYYNIGLAYIDLAEYENAVNHFNKVLNICKTGECSPAFNQNGILGLGMSYYWLGDYEKSKEYLQKIKNIDDLAALNVVYRFLSELSLLEKDYAKAMVYIDSSIFLAKEVKSREALQKNFLIKGSIFEETGQMDSALNYMQSHYALKDSLFNETIANSLQDLFVGFERQQANEEIKAREREISARKTANILLVLVVVLSIVLMVRIVIDLSRRKRINKYLDKQITRKTAELTKSYKDLSEKSKDLDNLIYNISHEIRGPLARLLGLINIGEIETKDDPDIIMYYDKLRNEALDLERILKRMIIINNVNHHKVHKINIDPRVFFNQLVDNSKYLWQDKLRIDLDLDGVQKIKTDTDLLEIALQNMIDNAVRFRNANGKVDAVLKMSLSKSSEGVDITFEDNGEGFDEKFVDSLTDLFFVASEKGGKGMGLHHTKLALDKIGAEFEVVSTRNPTTFVIHL